jgi:hypothetical protein
MGQAWLAIRRVVSHRWPECIASELSLPQRVHRGSCHTGHACAECWESCLAWLGYSLPLLRSEPPDIGMTASRPRAMGQRAGSHVLPIAER